MHHLTIVDHLLFLTSLLPASSVIILGRNYGDDALALFLLGEGRKLVLVVERNFVLSGMSLTHRWLVIVIGKLRV